MGPQAALLSRYTFLMKTILIAAICVILVIPATAQRFGGGFGGFRGGVPASVTSFGFGGQPGFGGVPASVTSPGFGFVPRNFVGFNGRGFNGRIIVGTGNQRLILNLGGRNRFGRGFGRGFFGGNGFGAFGFTGAIAPFFPAPVVVPFFDYSEGEAVQPENIVTQPGQPQPIVVVVPERGEREVAQPEAAPPPPRELAPAASAKPAPAPPPTVFVLRNGQKLELSDYALTSDTLYDLRDGRAKKISLAEVDLPATVKANEDRGVEFTLPNAARVHIQ